MKDSTKLWLVSLPFLLVGLAVVFTPLAREYMARRREEAWKKDPLTMQITVSKATEASSPHRYDSAGGMLFFEIGLLRLVMPAEGALGGGASSGCRIATTFTGTGGGSSGSGGGHQNSHREVPYGSEHVFSGPGYHYKFDVRQGCFCIGDRRICIVDTPKLIALESTGEIASVTDLSVSHPPLKGTASDIAALIDRAQKYAKVPPSEFGEEAWRMDPLQCQMQVKSVAEASSNSRFRGFGTNIVFETALVRLVIPEGGNAGSSSQPPPSPRHMPRMKWIRQLKRSPVRLRPPHMPTGNGGRAVALTTSYPAPDTNLLSTSSKAASASMASVCASWTNPSLLFLIKSAALKVLVS